jgi:cob(I)alamin adenosyltransferase
VGHRLSKIYTRTGDDGTTGLGDGTRVPKDHLRVEAYGTVDELNSALGVVLANHLPEDVRAALAPIQHELFDLGGELCIPGRIVLAARHVARLEQVLDAFNADLPPLKEFILPGGAEDAALLHLARTICRRAERHTVALARTETINPYSVEYLNRLSDLLFVAARYVNARAAGSEVLWRPDDQRNLP